MLSASLLCIALVLAPPAARNAGGRAGRPRMEAKLPTSPKEIATEMSLAVQAALGAGERRLNVELPEGLCFGLFGGAPGQQTLGQPSALVDAATKQRADRELAFLFCEMFQGLGDGATAVCFREEAMAQAAAREWAKGGLAAVPRIVLSPADLAPRRPKAAGFGKAAAGGGGTAEPPKVVLSVRPSKVELRELAALVKPLGDEVVVVLLNAPRLKSGGVRAGYEAAYSLLSNPHPGWRGGVLYRAYPGQWNLGCAAKVGGPRIHGRSAEKPSLNELDAGFARVKDDTSLVTGGALAAVGAAAALERIGDEALSLAGEVAAEARKEAEEGPGEILPGADKIRSFFGVD